MKVKSIIQACIGTIFTGINNERRRYFTECNKLLNLKQAKHSLNNL